MLRVLKMMPQCSRGVFALFVFHIKYLLWFCAVFKNRAKIGRRISLRHMTGAGVPALSSAIATLLPERRLDPDGPVAGKIFKIERGWGGEKLAYLYLTSGTLRLRQYLDLPGGEERVTAIHGRRQRLQRHPADLHRHHR